MSESSAIVWFRQDLRLADNPAFHAALQWGGPIIPLYIWAPEEEADWAPGGASRWWLHQSLQALIDDLRAHGSRLVIRRGDSLSSIFDVANDAGAGAVFWNRRYEPHIIERDRQIKAWLSGQGLEAQSFNGSLLHEPWTIATKTETPYQVFTPFWKTCLAAPAPPNPLAKPEEWTIPTRWPSSEMLSGLGLNPRPDWAAGLREAWRPGSEGAMTSLNVFLGQSLTSYEDNRDRPDLPGTSRLSPHLHFGEISPRQIWHAVRRLAELGKLPAATWKESQFITELGWREFGYHLLFHFPQTITQPLRPEFDDFPWLNDVAWLKAWQKGRTGYPIVDAGLRQLWATGWMHNRLRMIVASFLVKDLMLPWQEGVSWFWDTLVDADLASNTLGWQWSAGCGADAAPYFRIFNPVSQGEKFDPQGVYVRKWVPELANLPDAWVHKPWEAPPELLQKAEITLGKTYPERIVEHGIARDRALEAYQSIRQKK